MRTPSGRAGAPRRRVQINLNLGADTWDIAARTLDQIAFEIRRGNWRGPNGCSGGYDSGFTIESSEDESVTHESWYADLQSHLAKERAGAP